MNKIWGALLMAASLFFGVYVAGWVMFVGGIVSVFNMLNGTLVATGIPVAIAIAKILLAGTVAGLSVIPLVFGFKLFAEEK